VRGFLRGLGGLDGLGDLGDGSFLRHGKWQNAVLRGLLTAPPCDLN
jgi:hypothetical protein